MIPLSLCSLIAFAICVNRFFVLNSTNVLPYEVNSIPLPQLVKNSRDERWQEVSLFVIVRSIMDTRPANEEEGISALEAVLITEVHRLERFLTTLGTIASIAPLLGLLGTVLGMINVFTSLNVAGAGNASVFSGGIAQALFTTAFGLVIAIPCLIFHRHFQRQVDEYAVQLEREGTLFLRSLFMGENAIETSS